MKNILGLVASHRRLGNTEILVKEFLDSTGEDNKKEMIRLTDLNLEYCKACYACLPKGADCRINDDLGYLLNKIGQADVVVLAAPVYFLGPHAIIKTLQDRLLSVGSEQEKFRGKPCVTITTYGASGWNGYAQSALNLLAHFLHLDLADSILVHAANPGEACLSEDSMAKVREASKSLFDPDYKKDPGENRCPVCWSELFRFKGDGTVECPLCGTKGTVDNRGNKKLIQFTWDPVHNRLSPEGKREHFEKWLVMKKDEYLDRRKEFKELQKPYRNIDWWVTK